MGNPQTIKVAIEGQDELNLSYEVDGSGELTSAKLSVIGCPQMIEMVKQWRPLLKGPVASIPLPVETDHCGILLRQLILQLQGKWNFPYTDYELCHCRAVPTKKVDDAIVCGAKTVRDVSRKTSAGTACGTCRPDIEKVLKYRRGA
jgi:bacterioferritin-associated ferredoxin